MRRLNKTAKLKDESSSLASFPPEMYGHKISSSKIMKQ